MTHENSEAVVGGLAGAQTESVAKFTPGPWTVERLEYHADEDVSFEITADHYLVLQTIMREKATEAETIAEDEANVILAAAAPEMLAALREADKWISAERPHQAPNTSLQMIRAAITKATGVQ